MRIVSAQVEGPVFAERTVYMRTRGVYVLFQDGDAYSTVASGGLRGPPGGSCRGLRLQTSAGRAYVPKGSVVDLPANGNSGTEATVAV